MFHLVKTWIFYRIYTISLGSENINNTHHWTNATFLENVLVTFAEYNVHVVDVGQYDMNVTAAYIHDNYSKYSEYRK